jgi:hypothetical protein
MESWRIEFDDGGYLEFQRSNTPGKIWIIISAKQEGKPLENVVTSAEADFKKVLEGIESVTGPIMMRK